MIDIINKSAIYEYTTMEILGFAADEIALLYEASGNAAEHIAYLWSKYRQDSHDYYCHQTDHHGILC